MENLRLPGIVLAGTLGLIAWPDAPYAGQDDLKCTPSTTALPPGMSAVVLSLPSGTGIAGFILPGDLVNVVRVREDPESGRFETRVVLEGVEIQAVCVPNRDAPGSPSVRGNLTLLLEQQQSARLIQDASEGYLSVTLAGMQLAPGHAGFFDPAIPLPPERPGSEMNIETDFPIPPGIFPTR